MFSVTPGFALRNSSWRPGLQCRSTSWGGKCHTYCTLTRSCYFLFLFSCHTGGTQGLPNSALRNHYWSLGQPYGCWGSNLVAPRMAACKANTLPAMLLLQSLALLLLKSFSSICGKLCYLFSLYEKWITYYLVCYAANIFVVICFGMWLVHLFLTFFQIKLY